LPFPAARVGILEIDVLFPFDVFGGETPFHIADASARLLGQHLLHEFGIQGLYNQRLSFQIPSVLSMVLYAPYYL